MLKVLGILAGVLAIAVAGVYGWRFLFAERPTTPAGLAQAALHAGSAEERELAAVELTQLGKPAREYIVQVLAESKQPEVRAACIRGLADQWAYRQMGMLLDALEDESSLVRAQAGDAVQLLLKVEYRFNANAPPEQRQEMVKKFRERWKEFPNSKVRMAYIRQQEGEDYP
jgi:hypothetical protein